MRQLTSRMIPPPPHDDHTLGLLIQHENRDFVKKNFGPKSRIHDPKKYPEALQEVASM
jgi:hypothetical protein